MNASTHPRPHAPTNQPPLFFLKKRQDKKKTCQSSSLSLDTTGFHRPLQHTRFALCGFHDVTCRKRLPQSQPKGSGILLVAVAEHGANGFGGFFGVVEGDGTRNCKKKKSVVGVRRRERECSNLRKEVMHHVAVNDAVENVFANEAKGAVDSLQSTVGVVPSIGFEVLVIGVSVVEVCNRHCVFLI